MIAITTLKSVFSIQEIAQTLNILQTQASSDQLYDAFVDYMNQGIDPANPIIQTSCQTVKLYHQTLDLIDHTQEEVIQ
ncbi:BS_ykrK family protein [Streptococcus pneumoniae]|nr:BS_ykrK family protein [Streptococcus pneumoniae]